MAQRIRITVELSDSAALDEKTFAHIQRTLEPAMVDGLERELKDQYGLTIGTIAVEPVD